MSDPHEEIRFNKRDIKSLDNFPSAVHTDGMKVKTPRLRKKRLRRTRRAVLWASSFLILFFIVIVVLLKVGITGSFLTSKMQAVLSQQLGDIAEATISDARLSLDEDYHIALEARNVYVKDIKNGLQVDQIGVFKVGLSTLGLLRGKLQIQQIELHDANVILPQSRDSNFMATLPKDQFGRVDPDAIANGLFPAFDKGTDLLKKMSVNAIIFKNVSFRLPADDSVPLLIEDFGLRNRWKTTVLESQLQWDGKEIGLTGSANYFEGHASDIQIAVRSLPLHLGAADGVSPFLADGRTNNGHFRLKGNMDLGIDAHRASLGDAPVIHMQLTMPQGEMDVGTAQDIPATFDINLVHTPLSGKIELAPSKLIMGGVNIPFEGALGVVPAAGNGTKPDNDYRFEIVAHNAQSATEDVPDIALKFETKLAGQFNLSEKKAVIDEVALNTPHGSLIGQGSLRFGEGTPETIFVLHVPQMDVSEAKQLWPINISPGARRWVASHIYGGQLKNGTIEIALPLGFFRSGIPAGPLTEKEIRIRSEVLNTRSDLVGDLPALRDASGKIAIDGTTTTITLDTGISYLSNDRKLQAVEGTLIIPWGPQRPVYAEMNLVARGDVAAAGEMIGYSPINARNQLPFNPDRAVGNIEAEIDLRFPVTRDEPRGEVTYAAHVGFSDFSLSEPFNDVMVSAASGMAEVNKSGVILDARGLMNDLPADVKIVQPFNHSDWKKSEKITLTLDDSVRSKHFAFLNSFLSGPITVDVGPENSGKRHLNADLTNASLEFPWVGWKKGKGIGAHAQLDVPSDISKKAEFNVDNFALTGTNLQIAGTIHVKDKKLSSAEFTKANLSRGDNLALKITSSGKSYRIDANGQSFDARALIQQLGKVASSSDGGNAITLRASLASLTGFYGEALNSVSASYDSTLQRSSQLNLTAKTSNGLPVDVELSNNQGLQSITATSADAGSVLRFMNYYDKIRGGTLKANLRSSPGQPLAGPVSVRNFAVVNEPKLAKLVSSRPATGGKSLNDAVKGRIDSSSVGFDVAYAHIGKGDNYVVLDRGVLRGPTVGATFQGVLYDSSGNMSITGTFMPAYGLNRLFGDLPIIGQVLGNGRDRGLIGITFKIEGNAKQPQVMVNPISAIAPGIFRSIFEFQ